MSSRYTDEPKGPRRRLRRLVVRVKTPTPSRRLVLLRLSRHWPGRKVRVGTDYISISILVNEGRTTLRRVRRRVRKALEVNGFKRLRPDPLGWLFPLLVPGARRRGRPQKKSVVDAPEASLADLMSSYTPRRSGMGSACLPEWSSVLTCGVRRPGPGLCRSDLLRARTQTERLTGTGGAASVPFPSRPQTPPAFRPLS